jgi:hypothetical protein
VASLNAAAEAARVDATRLRNEARELKLLARGNLARSRERLDRAQVQTDRARATRAEPMPSPWSELRWTQPYETLEQTLVPLPPPPSGR